MVHTINKKTNKMRKNKKIKTKMKRVKTSKKNTKRRMRRGKRGGKFNDVEVDQLIKMGFNDAQITELTRFSSVKNIISFFGVQRKKGFSPQQIVEHSREVDTFDADTDYESDDSQSGGGSYYQSLDGSVPDFGKDPDLNANDRRDSK
jgi:hypothetical protein